MCRALIEAMMRNAMPSGVPVPVGRPVRTGRVPSTKVPADIVNPCASGSSSKLGERRLCGVDMGGVSGDPRFRSVRRHEKAGGRRLPGRVPIRAQAMHRNNLARQCQEIGTTDFRGLTGAVPRRQSRRDPVPPRLARRTHLAMNSRTYGLPIVAGLAMFASTPPAHALALSAYLLRLELQNGSMHQGEFGARLSQTVDIVR